MLVVVWWLGCVPRPGAVPDGQRCAIEGTERWCVHETVKLELGPLAHRSVHFQLPLGEPPVAGWPVALLFQGSFYPASRTWAADRGGPFGAWYQTETVEALLDAGWAVITPDTQGSGHTFWNTNVVPWSLDWESAPDHALMQTLLAELEAGTFGPLDPQRLSAAGISSGGYMTSRMALSYPGRFERLAIQSASWATCSGPLCVLPGELPDDHPPTLFLHGERDDVVPIETMERYRDRLEADGHRVSSIIDPEAGHAWLPDAPEAIVAWFADAG